MLWKENALLELLVLGLWLGLGIGRGVERHPRRRKMHHGNLGDKNK